jgi:short-subunit dehydrogenase
MRHFPGIGVYSATKAAVSALGEALKAEVKSLGIEVLSVDLVGHSDECISISA